MSVWASIPGTDTTAYEAEEGYDIDPAGWWDVAVHGYGDRVRIIVIDGENEARIALDPEGLAELHRRVVAARHALEQANLKNDKKGPESGFATMDE